VRQYCKYTFFINLFYVTGPVAAVSASAVQGSRKSDSGATAPAQEAQGKEKENRSRHLLHCLTTEQTVKLEQTRKGVFLFYRRFNKWYRKYSV
jgi:hypothetical protein